jgi:hypothetical protein
MKIASTLIGIVASLALLSPLKASTISRRGHVQANGITIAYEILGKGDRETILLIGGTGMQLTDWPTDIALRRLALFFSDSQRHDTVGERICPAQWEN